MGDVVMRGYQERVAAAARQGGNLIVVAPTGAGKTLPMVVHTAYVLQRDATARCIFLAPTQALALQQAGVGARLLHAGPGAVLCMRLGWAGMHPAVNSAPLRALQLPS